jgi:hypothetical protein
VPSVPVTVRWYGSVPFETTATGFDGDTPEAISRRVVRARARSPISTTTVGIRATASQSMAVGSSHWCPVTTTNAEPCRRWVTGIPARPGTAIADVTPGITA